MDSKLKYILHLGDNALILGQRLGEWCGHGPILEQDMALTNIALDLIGQARLYYQYAAQIDGNKTENDYAYHRDHNEFLNLLLTEYPNGDFGQTIIRQLFYSVFNYHQLKELSQSPDDSLRAIAEKSIKEVKYHMRFSREWTIRLGDGTEESHKRMQDAIDVLWTYTGELFMPALWEGDLISTGDAADITAIKSAWYNEIKNIFSEATLVIPDHSWHQSGGKNGLHSEHMSYILGEMQIIPRTYPDAKW